MTYTLAIGDHTYSSWSLRGWLLFAAFDLPAKVRREAMYQPGFRDMLDQDFSPSRTVPALLIEDVGTVVWDSLAIAETLAERHPDIRYWPEDQAARATARALTAEMHSGFSALRQACPMNIAHGWDGFIASEDVLADLKRLEKLWALARERFGGDGPWLFGHYSVADVFFAPVAYRILGYGLPVGDIAMSYVQTQAYHTPMRQWRAMGRAHREYQSAYEMGLPKIDWPGPKVIAAEPVTDTTAINTHCPYSGKPVAADGLARIEGKVIGFCNPFCRDKTVADPEAWPKAMKLVR